MSKTTDGKLANQHPRYKFNSGNPSVVCECCQKSIINPDVMLLSHFESHVPSSVFTVFSYIQTPYFIYESNSGRAVVYCSDYCRKKHNHRFQK